MLFGVELMDYRVIAQKTGEPAHLTGSHASLHGFQEEVVTGLVAAEVVTGLVTADFRIRTVP